MKQLFLCIALITTLSVAAQNTEFAEEQDQLMYSDQTMRQLKHIADSLNLKFRACGLQRTYFSRAQAKGHFLEVTGARAQAAARMIDDGATWTEVEKAFPTAEIQRDMLILRSIEEDYEGQEYVQVNGVQMGNQPAAYVHIEDLALGSSQQLQGKWLSNFHAERNAADSRLVAFYFETNFITLPLDERYARMVQYVDCMVDTSTVVFAAEAEAGYRDLDLGGLDTMTLDEKKALLLQLRNTRVVGGCSQDQGPRIHARNIAIAAAESISWEVFLRAHLDIMNDRFDRMSDGSYAQAQRFTYIHELELLDINTLELLLGMSFRIENPSENHYYGSIPRLGRAIAEAQDVVAIEKQILGMIQDPKLDDFNRVIMHNLFLSYIYQDKNEDRRSLNIERFKTACTALPEYLAKHVEVEEE